MMTQLSEGQYMSPRVINLAMQYLTHAVDLKPSYKLLKPHIDPLWQQVVFPLMCFTEEDAELWEEDPTVRAVSCNAPTLDLHKGHL